MSRTNEPTVTIEEASRRLREWGLKENRADELWPASMLADVIWPENTFLSAQGAGAAASRMLKKVGARYYNRDRDRSRGWSIMGIIPHDRSDA